MADLHVIDLSSGRKLAYAQYGDPTGRPLFFYHGWPSSRLYGELLDDLGKRKGICVIAPDRPGIGHSDAQPDRTMLDWPPVIAELANQLGYDRFHVAGVSGGGPYALATLQELPQRVTRAAVICGAPPLTKDGMQSLLWTYRTLFFIRERIPYLLDQGLRLAARMAQQKRDGFLMKRLIGTFGAEDQRALATGENYRIITGAMREALRSGAKRLSEDGDLYFKPWGFDLTALPSMPQFHHGALDRNVPLPVVEAYIRSIPGAKLVLHAMDGHYSLPTLRVEEILDALFRE